MPTYTVTVATGSQWFAGTDDYIYITLVGTERCSERTLLDKPLYNDFERGAVSSYRFQFSEVVSTIVRFSGSVSKKWPDFLYRPLFLKGEECVLAEKRKSLLLFRVFIFFL